MQKVIFKKKSAISYAQIAVTLIVCGYALLIRENIGSVRPWFYVYIARTIITSVASAVGNYLPNTQEIALDWVLFFMLVHVGLFASVPFIIILDPEARFAMCLITANKAFWVWLSWQTKCSY